MTFIQRLKQFDFVGMVLLWASYYFLVHGGYIVGTTDGFFAGGPKQEHMWAFIMAPLGIWHLYAWMTMQWRREAVQDLSVRNPTFFAATVWWFAGLAIMGAALITFVPEMKNFGFAALYIGFCGICACTIWRIRMNFWRPEPPTSLRSCGCCGGP